MNKKTALSIQKGIDEQFMSEAVDLAYKAKGMTSPNPLVGAVIVRNGRIIGRGFHSGYGKPHAEIEAIRSVKGSLKDATMYVTLEPCNIHGKTPPCTEAIMKLPLKRIVIGMNDPNPAVSGRSVRMLRKAGYEVTTGILRNQVMRLNPYYAHFIRTKKTYFIMKAAMSIDGYIAPDRKGKHYLTSEASRAIVHEERFKCDAVLIGANTVNTDNPVMDTSLYSRNIKPVLIILDNSNKLDYSKNVIKDRSRKKIIVTGKDRKPVKRSDIEYVHISSKQDAWKQMEDFIFSRNIGSVLIEGGASVFTDALKNDAIDELIVFTAPVILGKGVRGFDNTDSMHRFRLSGLKRTGKDILARYICSQD